MKVKIPLGLLLTALLIVGSASSAALTTLMPASSQLRLLRSDEQAVLLELVLDGFETKTIVWEGGTYQRIIIPDMGHTVAPGAPQVPTRGTLLGLPSADGVSARILEATYDTLHGFRLLPAAQLSLRGDSLVGLPAGGVNETLILDSELYATDAFFPDSPVEVGDTGYMREQAVAQVQFYPVQYNPHSGELRLYRRILAEITWTPSGATTRALARGISPAYETLLRDALLNYDALDRPSVTDALPALDRAGAKATAGIASAATVKIGVTEDGLYELTYNDLVGAGLDLNGVDPRTIKISNLGTEVPIYVHGESDGMFNTDDTVLFYGTAVTDIYTTENVYWLTTGGPMGQRMATRDGTPSVAPVPAHFPVTLHLEQDNYYWQTMPDGAGQDHWFWGDRVNAPGTRDFGLTLNNISTAASTAAVRVKLKGATDDPNSNPDHHTKVYLNGVEIDDQHWDGMAIYDHQATSVSHALFNEGNNTLRLESVGDTGAAVDQLFANWIEIDYWDTYVAEGDALLFGAPSTGTFSFEVTGFGVSAVDVFDVTNPPTPVRITGATVAADGEGFKLEFKGDAGPNTRYLALAPSQRKSPASIKLDQPSAWKSSLNGADYVIITHQDFYTSSLRLDSHRGGTSGLRVATVIVEDIYDEFNYGIFNPQAIRDLLSYAYHNWIPPAPVYVLLIGDAYQDYKDNLGTGTVNYVPSQIVETQLLGETPSDNWFVLLSGDDVLPEMLIGRLSAQTVAQVDDIIDKIIRYEQNPPDDTWNTKVLLVADDDLSSFEAISEQLAARLPPYYTATRVYVSDYPPGDPTTDIANAINGGAVFVNYVGHGKREAWGNWGEGQYIFDNADVSALTNVHKLPVVTVGNCLNGFFTGRKTYVSMAETFQRLEDRGALAVWAPTGLGFPSGHRALIQAFYDAIFQDDQYALGAATTAAKIAVYSQSSFWSELVETFVLFGDPATPVGIPTDMRSSYMPLVIGND